MPRYEISKGVDNEIEFYGLRGKWVWRFFIGAGGSIFLGIMLFLLLPSQTLAALLAVGAITAVVYFTLKGNRRYGRWGMEKKAVEKKLPAFVVMQRPFTLRRKKDGKTHA
jgi:uncharacterized membrane protein YfcA